MTDLSYSDEDVPEFNRRILGIFIVVDDILRFFVF
jgi:hypothetical protein